MEEELIKLLPVREGHFKMESGYHASLSLDLDAFLLYPKKLEPFISELGRRLMRYDIEAICAPLSGGALVGILIASEFDKEFYYTERFENQGNQALYGAKYRIPKSLRNRIRGRRFAIVDDAINAGSAVGATVKDLQECGAIPVVLAALLVQTPKATQFAADIHMPLENIASRINQLWVPTECELCVANIPLEIG